MESVEDHREHFIVIVLRGVDDSSNATSHNHSIIIDVREEHGKFDVVTLMAALQGTDMESLNDDFISKQLFSWQEETACSIVKKLRGVWQMLDKYAIITVAKAASAKKGQKRQSASIERGDTTPKRGRGGSCPGSSRAEAQKRNRAQSSDSGEGTQKRSKPTAPERTAEGEGADWDLQVRPTDGGFREIRQNSGGILAEPQGVLPVQDGSYKSTHQPVHHSARRFYNSNAAEVIG